MSPFQHGFSIVPHTVMPAKSIYRFMDVFSITCLTCQRRTEHEDYAFPLDVCIITTNKKYMSQVSQTESTAMITCQNHPLAHISRPSTANSPDQPGHLGKNPEEHAHYVLSSLLIAGIGLAVGANLLLCLIFAPYFQKINGMGASTNATKPSSVPAQLTPRALNMYMLKRGKTAPARERRKVLAAIAEAALWGMLVSEFFGVDEGGKMGEEREDAQHEISIYEIIE